MEFLRVRSLLGPINCWRYDWSWIVRGYKSGLFAYPVCSWNKRSASFFLLKGIHVSTIIPALTRSGNFWKIFNNHELENAVQNYIYINIYKYPVIYDKFLEWEYSIRFTFKQSTNILINYEISKSEDIHFVSIFRFTSPSLSS